MKIKLGENLPERIVAGLSALGHDTDTGLVLRLADDRSSAAAERLVAVFQTEAVEAWSGCLVVVSDHKVCGCGGRGRTQAEPGCSASRRPPGRGVECRT
jgi:hypothetical protein